MFLIVHIKISFIYQQEQKQIQIQIIIDYLDRIKQLKKFARKEKIQLKILIWDYTKERNQT